MKFSRLFGFLIAGILFLGSVSESLAIDGHIRITSPNGGESYKVGDTVTITWDSSPNIDKVSIGWSTGPGSLNWIAFTAPNTGSYTWNVNVGNTTNTQFVIDITGWETGAGSLSDRSDGYFTVASNSQPTAAPTNSPTPTASTSVTGNSSSNSKTTAPQKISPTPTPTPRPVYLSITNINIWDIFIFDGSSTTDLSKITDPKHVSNFTLDTQEGYEFVFLEELDLTNQNTLKAIANIDDYWVVETWFFWIKWEWWEVYKIDTPIEVAYKDERLTSFEPIIIDEGKVADPESKSKAKESSYKVLGTEDGELKIEVTGGAKLKVEPKVELSTGETVNTSSSSVALNGKSSHKDLKYFVKINGKESEISLSKFDEKSGEWEMKIDGLVEGANFTELYFKDGENEKVKFGETTILFTPSFWSMWGKYVLGAVAALGLVLLGVLMGIYLPKLKTVKIKQNLRDFFKKTKDKFNRIEK